MKHVFTDLSTIAHMWANQTQDNARNSGNFYFEGRTIYSYGRHFPIARHVENKEGVKSVLFTERRYSNTTAKHISIVRQAASHKDIIYCSSPDSTHTDNFNQWQRKMEGAAQGLTTARKPEKYLSAISYTASHVIKYAEFWGIEIPAPLKALMSIGNKEEYQQYAAKKQEYELAEKVRAEKELKTKHKKELNKWLKGDTNRLYIRDGFDYLRIAGNKVETSQAVELPIDYAKKLYLSLKDGKMHVGSKVFDYEVSEVGKVVKVGCHTFKTDYLLKFGAKL